MENRISELRGFGMVIGEGCMIADDLEIEEAWASHITFGSEITVARGVAEQTRAVYQHIVNASCSPLIVGSP